MTRSRFRTVLYAVAAFVSLVGLGEATYLTVIYLTGAAAVCGGSASCFEVLGSKYAKIGGIPITAFGTVAYFTVFGFAVFAAFGYLRARAFFALAVWAMFGFTLWLLFVQAFILHAFCRYCLFSAAMIFLLAGIVVASPPSD